MILQVLNWLCFALSGGAIGWSIAAFVYRLQLIEAREQVGRLVDRVASEVEERRLARDVSTDVDVGRSERGITLSYYANGLTYTLTLTDEQAAKLVHAIVGEFTP